MDLESFEQAVGEPVFTDSLVPYEVVETMRATIACLGTGHRWTIERLTKYGYGVDRMLLGSYVGGGLEGTPPRWEQRSALVELRDLADMLADDNVKLVAEWENRLVRAVLRDSGASTVLLRWGG
jgi:hypothetical protein